MADSVSYSVAFTRNMGNFESLKLGIGASFDVRDGETEDEALARVKAFVSEGLLTDVDEVESEVRGVRSAADQRKIDEAKERESV